MVPGEQEVCIVSPGDVRDVVPMKSPQSGCLSMEQNMDGTSSHANREGLKAMGFSSK